MPEKFKRVMVANRGEIELEEGKRLIVKLLGMEELDDKGRRRVDFEVNGFRREIRIADKASGDQKGFCHG